MAGFSALHRCGFALLALNVLALAASAASARAQPVATRLAFSGWAGWFTDIRGFSEGQLDAFYRLDTAPAFGGGIHYTFAPGLQFGVDGLYSSLSYERFTQTGGVSMGSGDAKAGSLVVSSRFAAGGGGRFTIYISGAGGIFAWDLDDPDLEEGWDLDPTLGFSIGLEYLLILRAGLFAEYGQFWIYHEKDENVSSNTARVQLLRFGARLRL